MPQKSELRAKLISLDRKTISKLAEKPTFEAKPRETRPMEDQYALARVTEILHPAQDISPMEIPYFDTFYILSTIELDRIREDISSIVTFFAGKKLLHGAELNLKDLQSAYKRYLPTFRDNQYIPNETMEEVGVNLARLLLNLLSMIKAFLEHPTARIKRRARRSPTKRHEVTLWKNTIYPSYNSSFVFLLMHWLRNHIQHTGSVPFIFNFSEGKPWSLDLVRNTFLDVLRNETDKWKVLLRDALAGQPQHIPLLPLIDEYWSEIGKAFELLTRIELPYLVEPARRILHWRTLYPFPHHEPFCIMKEPSSDDSNRVIAFSYVWLPEEESTLVLEMASQHE